MSQRSDASKQRRMTDIDRELIFRVVDGDNRLFITLSHWYRMINFRAAMCFCLENRLTGKILYEWLKLPPHDGIFNGYGFILGRLNKEKKVYQIRAGKEYLA